MAARLRVYLNYKIFMSEPDSTGIKNVWIDLNQENREDHQLSWVRNLKDDNINLGNRRCTCRSNPKETCDFDHVGTLVHGDSLYSLRQLIMRKIRLQDVEIETVEKKAFLFDYWSDEDKKKMKPKLVEKVHIFTHGPEVMELTEPEDKITNLRQYTVSIYLKRKRGEDNARRGAVDEMDLQTLMPRKMHFNLDFKKFPLLSSPHQHQMILTFSPNSCLHIESFYRFYAHF